MDPGRLKKWLIAAAIFYLVLPRDLVPDFLGRGLGYLEDIVLIALGTWYYRKYRQRQGEPAAPGAGSQRGREQAGPQQPRGSAGLPDPYQVLGVARTATTEEIRSAYRARMAEYHPDKVSHLGEELQQLAHRKALEIQQAYREIGR